MTEKQLLELKAEIEVAKSKKAELTGQKNALMKQLKEEWGCTSIEMAERKIKQLEKDITKLNDKLKQGGDELNEKYPA